jgi:uncharacterized protein YoxC
MYRTEQIEFFIIIFAMIVQGFRSINKIVDDVTLQVCDVKHSLTEIENKTSDITLEFNKIKEHASDHSL